MNRIIETIEREKIIKKHRRSVAKKSSFYQIIPDSILDYFDRENIKSIELREREGGEGFYWLIEHSNSKPGKFHYSVDDKVPEPENSVLKEILKKIGTNKLTIEQNQNQHHDFSEVNLLAGEEHNQELVELKNQTNIWETFNLIDFNQHGHENPEFIERRIKEIYNEPVNKRLIEKGEFPVICFKNIEKIGQNQALEEALLPVFDKQQNAELFNKEVDLSKFILIATTSTHETEKLSDPLLSRLNWVNADTAQPKKFFLDKYYYWFLAPSLLINLILLALLLLPKLKKKQSIPK
jgi:hypothetical protein